MSAREVAVSYSSRQIFKMYFGCTSPRMVAIAAGADRTGFLEDHIRAAAADRRERDLTEPAVLGDEAVLACLRYLCLAVGPLR